MYLYLDKRDVYVSALDRVLFSDRPRQCLPIRTYFHGFDNEDDTTTSTSTSTSTDDIYGFSSYNHIYVSWME